jgi:hypothetical protein
MTKTDAPTPPAMTSDSGILLTLLKERVPNWYAKSAAVLQAKLNEIAEAVFGDTSAVPGLMGTVERMKAKEARDAEIAARLALYTKGFNDARMCVAHFVTGQRQRVALEARHTEELARIERNQSGLMSQIYRFIQAFPEAEILPGWPRLDPKYHPENLEATAAVDVAETPEAAKLQRHRAELAEASKLRAAMTQWGRDGHKPGGKPRATA